MRLGYVLHDTLSGELINKFKQMLQEIKIHGILHLVVKVTNGQLAQLVEQRTLNPWVQGSSPWLSTILKTNTICVGFLFWLNIMRL